MDFVTFFVNFTVPSVDAESRVTGSRSVAASACHDATVRASASRILSRAACFSFSSSL